MARIVQFMCACVFKNIIYLGARLTQLCLCLFCPLSAGKGGSSGRCARLLLRAAPLRPESGICRFRGRTLPIGIIQQQARFRCGHGCFSRRAFLFPFPSPPRVASDRSVPAHRQHVSPFLTTLPEDSTGCCGLFSPGFAGMVHGDVWRPAAARKQLRTSLATATRNMLTIWTIKTQNKEIMSSPKGGGMASKERLYELWMLYYTKVRASAEELTVTPVVAAGPPGWTFRHWQGSSGRFLCRLFEKLRRRGVGEQVSGIFFLGSSSCLFTKRVMTRYPPNWAV